jgi:hypothetical protein
MRRRLDATRLDAQLVETSAWSAGSLGFPLVFAVSFTPSEKELVMSKIVVALLVGLALVLSVSAIAVAEEVKCDGAITKIEGANVTVKTATESHTLTVDDKTKITVNGSAAKLADLKVGQKVKCTGDKVGTKVTCTAIDATSA